MSTRKLIILFLAIVPLLVLDLGSKMWAESNLATPMHPFVFKTSGGDSEGSLQDFLSEKLGPKAEGDWNTFIQTRVLQLSEEDVLRTDDILLGGDKSAPRTLFVFSRDGEGIPPRALWVNEPREAFRQAKEANPAATPAELRAKVKAAIKEQSLSSYIAEKIPYVEAEEAVKLIQEGKVLQYRPKNQVLRASDPIAAEAYYVVLTHKIPVIPEFLQFSYAENPGAAWGFLGTAPPTFRHIFFTLISIIAVFGMGWMMRRLEDDQTLYLVAFGTMLSGAIGNFVDRMRFRYVIDFIDMYVGQSHWPTYNVADIAISIGFGLILLDLLFLTGGKGVFDDEDKAEENAA